MKCNRMLFIVIRVVKADWLWIVRVSSSRPFRLVREMEVKAPQTV